MKHIKIGSWVYTENNGVVTTTTMTRNEARSHRENLERAGYMVTVSMKGGLWGGFDIEAQLQKQGAQEQ